VAGVPRLDADLAATAGPIGLPRRRRSNSIAAGPSATTSRGVTVRRCGGRAAARLCVSLARRLRVNGLAAAEHGDELLDSPPARLGSLGGLDPMVYRIAVLSAQDLWAAHLGTARAMSVDAELLYVAAVLHDLGLLAEFDNHALPFEVGGGHVAAVFAAGSGWQVERRRRVAGVIVAHMADSVDPGADPEGFLLERATAFDISGRASEDFPAELRSAVLDRYPRQSSRRSSSRVSRIKPAASRGARRPRRCGPVSPNVSRPTRSKAVDWSGQHAAPSGMRLQHVASSSEQSDYKIQNRGSESSFAPGRSRNTAG
jgi:hypothetical protein